MRVRYDTDTDILTVVFREAEIAESDEDKPGIVIDYDDGGRVVAIEIREASRRVDQPRSVTVDLLSSM